MKIYDDKQGSIELMKGAFGHNIIITRHVCPGHDIEACVGDFKKEKLQEIANGLQEYINSLP